MLRRRHLPGLLLPVTAARAAAFVLPVRAEGAAAAWLPAVAARVAALSDGGLRLEAGPGGAVLGAPPLLPFAGFPCGMSAAELAHWLGSADGATLWAEGWALRGMQGWPVGVATRPPPRDRSGPLAQPHGAVMALSLPSALAEALGPARREILAAAGAAQPEATDGLSLSPGADRFALAMAAWLQQRFDQPEARCLRLAERFGQARRAAFLATACQPGAARSSDDARWIVYESTYG